MKIKQTLASCIMLLASCLLPLSLAAQTAFNKIERNPNFAAGSYGLYPEGQRPQLTPAPQGYEPFYISHYGRHGSRYLSDMKAYTIPYNTLAKADSLGKLTAVGQMALREMRLNIADAEGRWGDLSEVGKRQVRDIAHRMVLNFPQVFSNGAFVDARSTLVTRCVLSMGTTVLQLVKERPDLQVTMRNSYSDMWYLNPQNKLLRDSATNYRARMAFDAYVNSQWRYRSLMELFFNDKTYVHQHVSEKWMSYYLMKAALMQANTNDRSQQENPLLQLMRSEDMYLFWKIENAWSYINSGFCLLNSAKQPYLQHFLLRKLIDDADEVINCGQHGASLRFGHETVLLPLACLMGINGYDLRTDKLDELERRGWWANLVNPMGGNIQIVFYRKNPQDHNPLLKVLLNEKEATLPLPSDIAPYYRWSDFRDYYLRKVAEGESVLSAAKR